ncbi:MAG: DUF4382 domain-containing protein [Pseudomonadales bacterium]|nr:DUF4382 domain-containing protein [Pseudomonadales bacterium]
MKKLLPLLPLAFLAACGSDSDNTGQLSIGVTDAPIDSASNVFVEFTAVELKPKSGASFIIELDAPTQIDLLAYQGSASAPLVESEVITAGEYNWIRLHINAEEGTRNSYIVLDDGTEHALTIPSGAQSGLKMNRGFTVAAGGITDFTIDFDLRKSINAPTQEGGEYKLRPTLRIVDSLNVVTISGVINDYPCLAEQTAAVYLFAGDVAPVDVSESAGPITTAFVSMDAETGDYAYELGFIAAGEYTMAYTCDAASDDPELVDSLAFSTPWVFTVAEDDVTLEINL